MNGWLVGILLLSVGCRGAGVVWQQRQGYNKHEWIGQIARFFYFVGIPYLAVVSGLLSPRLFGLRGAEHLALIEWDTSRVLAGIQRAFTLITLEWVFDSPVTITFGTAALLLVWLIRRNLIRHQTPLPNLPQTLLHVFYAALHWAWDRLRPTTHNGGTRAIAMATPGNESATSSRLKAKAPAAPAAKATHKSFRLGDMRAVI